ncbi:MAG TPA: phosphodiester glycosidase family protein [Cyclobacteriaceae bacterium]|jgi:uncharacterized protein YigE (DUF2233 family)|nr:phosphodiester glycosidase family protein [Cyclobacteriaceae bacterium]
MAKFKFFVGVALVFFLLGADSRQNGDSRFLSFVAEPATIKFYWKDDKGQIFRSFQNLKSFIDANHHELKFAMNGGMYLKDNSPQGLYIENNITLKVLDTLSGTGNFYLKPNGVFYLTKDNRAIVCETSKFLDNGQINFATQSGPMLLVDGKIHPAFKQGSKNLNIRNGVGILPDNKVVFAISKEEVNFYDFAEFFKNLKCKNALYLDGFVSRAYLPEVNLNQLEGDFGVIIGVSK